MTDQTGFRARAKVAGEGFCGKREGACGVGAYQDASIFLPMKPIKSLLALSLASFFALSAALADATTATPAAEAAAKAACGCAVGADKKVCGTDKDCCCTGAKAKKAADKAAACHGGEAAACPVAGDAKKAACTDAKCVEAKCAEKPAAEKTCKCEAC